MTYARESASVAASASSWICLEDKFTAPEDFKVVAKGTSKFETEGNVTTKVELKP